MIHDAPIDDICEFISDKSSQFHFVKKIDKFKYEFSNEGAIEFFYIRNVDETNAYIKYLLDTQRYDMIGILLTSMKTKSQKELYSMLSTSYKSTFTKFNDFQQFIDPMWDFESKQSATIIIPIVDDIGVNKFVKFIADYVDVYNKGNVAYDLKKSTKKSLKHIIIADYFTNKM